MLFKTGSALNWIHGAKQGYSISSPPRLVPLARDEEA
jgi:hypothetical protein